MTTTTPEPGIYEGIPFEEYLAWEAVSNSKLSLARRSLLHFHSTPPKEATPAMRLGSLTHHGQLEPLDIAKRYAVMPAFENEVRRPDGSEYANPRASAAYKKLAADFELENSDKVIVTLEEYGRMVGMVTAISEDDVARGFLCTKGPVEVSIVWDDPKTGLRCKGRIDKWQRDERRIVDLKTTTDASDFPRTMARFGYHRQGAFYAEGLRVLTGQHHTFAIVVAETTAPFGVMAAPVNDEALTAGRHEFRDLLDRVHHARETDRWPGYQSPKTWNLPEWALSSDEPLELSVAGQSVNL